MLRIYTMITALFVASGALADSGLQPMVTGNDSRGWEAVGRLDFDGKSFCTGTLISDDLVLTAAHCLYDVRTDAPHGPRDVTFRAGWRNGFAHAVRSARAIYVHPNFSISHGSAQHRLTNDLALIQLDSPIRDGRIQPFDTDLRPAKGASVAVVSYAHDRADAPSMQSQCGVLARQGGVIVTSCDVDFGSSGAPIFSVENGEVSVVSVVSAKVQFRGQRASVGTALGANLGQILDLAEKGSSHFQQVSDASALFPEITNIEFVRAVSAALEE